MFCSSLRKRPDWTSLPRILLEIQTPRWQERDLQTCDIALPIPLGGPQHDLFRLLVLSCKDMQPSATYMERVERLYHQTGGRDIGIIFLMQNDESPENGVRSLMLLQASLLPNFELSILPLASLTALAPNLLDFQKQLIKSKRAARARRSGADSMKELLPYCSVNGPLPEHARYVVSDICNGISALAQAATTQDGQLALKDHLGDVAEDIIEFWGEEYCVDG